MIPLLYIGAPGIGKTASVRAEFDYVEVLLLSAMTEEDIAGLPYRQGSSEKRTTPLFIERLQKRPKGETTCLFLDELDKARREVADTLLTLLTHPADFGLPANTVIRAAANPPEWGGGDGISQAMLSRFAVIPYTVDVAKWSAYLRNTYPRHGDLVDYLLDGIASGKAPLLEAAGEGLDMRITCPRTWDYALHIITTQENTDDIIKGLLTPNAATYLASFTSKDTDQQFARHVAAKARTASAMRVSL